MDNIATHHQLIDLTGVPDTPGCYLFSDHEGKIIYIGKARSLKKRVRNYFQENIRDAKTRMMTERARGLDIIVTDTELEALVLENTLIKKHRPRFNINLKESQKYAYIRLTGEPFPRLLVARSKQGGGELFGPFVSAAGRDHLLAVLKKSFKLRTCPRFPKKPCLRFHIKLCDAPCTGNITQEAYDENIRQARQVLKGKGDALLEDMEALMRQASQGLYFERALELRNRIQAVKRLKERQNMEREKRYDEDVLNYTIRNNNVFLILFNVYKGTLANKQVFEFEAGEDFLQEFIIRYYSENPIPAEIIAPEEVEDTILEFLKMRAGRGVRVITPSRGEKKQLLDLVAKNIEITFFGDQEKMADLRRRLKMQDNPEVIECFDISHISGFATVASMVQFRNAIPDKSNYRRYRIKTVKGVDDFSSIAEVVRRRYARLVQENAPLPDLVVIDGGVGQLNAAVAVIQEMGVRIPTISLAKRFEEIWIPGADEPLILNPKSKALLLLRHIRDEAHRFALTYNRLLRKKDLLEEE